MPDAGPLILCACRPPGSSPGPPDGRAGGWRRRNPVLDDPRFKGARKSLESLVAGAMGDGRWTEEHLDNDRVRFRNGPQCVEVQRTRAGQLGLGGAAFRDLWAAKPC